VLLEKIMAGKKRLIAQGNIAQEKPLPPIAPSEIPFELPQGWEWVRFSRLASARTETPFYSRTAAPANCGRDGLFIQ
jgi:type I restriction enzyme, S subunit